MTFPTAEDREICPLCDGELIADKHGKNIYCNNPYRKHEFVCINNNNAKTPQQQIIQDHEIVERLKYDIQITKEAIKLKPKNKTYMVLLEQLEGTLNGNKYNYPLNLLKSILGNKK